MAGSSHLSGSMGMLLSTLELFSTCPEVYAVWLHSMAKTELVSTVWPKLSDTALGDCQADKTEHPAQPPSPSIPAENLGWSDGWPGLPQNGRLLTPFSVSSCPCRKKLHRGSKGNGFNLHTSSFVLRVDASAGSVVKRRIAFGNPTIPSSSLF